MITDTDKKISSIDKELKQLDIVKESLSDRIRTLKSAKSDKIKETKKIVDWALVTSDVNVKELREQWLMAAKLIYDEETAAAEENKMPSNMQPTRVLNQDEIDSLLGFEDEDDDDQDDLAAEWENMMSGEAAIDDYDEDRDPNNPSMDDILGSIRRILQENKDS